MRQELKKIIGARQRFIATFERFGTKKGYQGREIKTYCFINIRSQRGQPICDHLWMSQMKGMEELNLQPGDNICFDARVKRYTKGYRGRRELNDEYSKPIEVDYKLSHPTNIVKSATGSQGQLF